MSATYYSERELRSLGINLGKNVLVHHSVLFFGGEHISIGDDTRIDAFAILSAGERGIYIGSNVHLAASVQIFGSGGRVRLDDFVGLSGRVSVYSASDDYSGAALTNPTVPEKFRKVTKGDVLLREHVIVGCGSVIMPGVTLGIASAVGALSFVDKDVPDFAVVSGNPIRIVGKRDQKVIEIGRAFRNEKNKTGNS
jgi:galactoside O-acetyltransferase